MFLKSELDEANYIVKAAALVPDKIDLNGEAIRKEDIYKAAIKFMEYQKVDSQHDFVDGKGKVVFNWILDTDETKILMDGSAKEYPAGTWMVGVKINDPKEWDLIKSGQRRGFSIAGFWNGMPAYDVTDQAIEIPAKATGPGGHVADGTGPHGAGAGPGNGNADGSGMNDDDDNDDDKRSQSTRTNTTEGIDMDDDQLKELLEGHKKALMDAQSAFLTTQKSESEALVKAMSESNEAHVKAMSDISEAVKSLADAVAKSSAKADDEEKPEDEDEEKPEDDKTAEKNKTNTPAPAKQPDAERKTTASKPDPDPDTDAEPETEDINAYIKSYKSPLKVKRSEPCN